MGYGGSGLWVLVVPAMGLGDFGLWVLFLRCRFVAFVDFFSMWVCCV